MLPLTLRRAARLFWGPRLVGRAHGVAGVLFLLVALLDSWLTCWGWHGTESGRVAVGVGERPMMVMLASSAFNGFSALIGLSHLPKLLPEFLFHGAIMQLFFVAFSICCGAVGDEISTATGRLDEMLAVLFIAWAAFWMLPQIFNILFKRMSPRERVGMVSFIPVAMFHLIFNLWFINFVLGIGVDHRTWWNSISLLSKRGYLISLEKSQLANALGSIVITFGYRGVCSWNRALQLLLLSYAFSTLLLVFEWRAISAHLPEWEEFASVSNATAAPSIVGDFLGKSLTLIRQVV